MPSPALGAYLWLARRADPLAARLLAARIRRGKEDPERVSERLGHPGRARPKGPLVWLHAASVGESLSVLELMRRIRARRPDLTILVTTGTRSSAEMMAVRLPEGVLHQYAPVDLDRAVRRFLGHWRPGLAIWIENEIWPTMIVGLAREGVRIVLVNARISERSARRWRFASAMIARLLGSFGAVYAQDEASAARLRSLGAAEVTVTGTLKEGSAPLRHDEAERQRISARLNGRPLWLAASTHEGEEAICAEAHREIRRLRPDALMILVPRHPERGPAIADALAETGARVGLRSRGDAPETGLDIFVADTLGELGLWYRLSSVAFLGGSLVPVGGHNPYEPAALGSAIIHGPHVGNFVDGYGRLARAEAACGIADAAGLAATVHHLLSPEVSAAMATAAWGLFSEGAQVTDRVMAGLEPLLPESE